MEIDGSSKSSVNDGIAEALAGEIEPKAEKEYASSMFVSLPQKKKTLYTKNENKVFFCVVNRKFIKTTSCKLTRTLRPLNLIRLFNFFGWLI